MGNLCNKDSTAGGHGGTDSRGGGKRLGGRDGNPADARERMLAAAEARNSGVRSSGVARTDSKPSRSSGSTRRSGDALGGSTGPSHAGTAAAKAAEDRAALGGGTGTGGLSAEKQKELAVRRQKDDLIGQIRHHYRRLGEDEPIGLPSASVDALKKTLASVKRRSAGR